MVTETYLKTGYWRTDPVTGGREWIEGSYQPKKPKLEEEAPVTPIPMEEEDIYLRPTEPLVEAPPIEVAEIAGIYGLPAGRFVTGEQLADLSLPLAERVTQIPYEQYLTWKQAKQLGFDVPEGSVVVMVPMAEGEPSFFPMPTLAEVEATQKWIELEDALRNIYPEMFDPAMSYGYTPEQIPAMVIEQLGYRMQRDYQSFVDDLYARVGEFEAERILRLFGVTEENILLSLEFEKQEERVTNTIQAVFPDYSLKQFSSLIETDFELFMESIQTGGNWTEKRQLLEEMGYNPDEINQIFSRRRLTVDIDGISKLLTIDIETKIAYDERGNYVGSYNFATKEFTRAKEENILKNFWDWTVFQSRTMWEQGENFFLSVMPNIIYADMPEGYMGGLGEFLNETNRQMRERFRYTYNANKVEYERWVKKHPELIAPINYQEGAYQHPELLKDPSYYAYELASILPFILTATGVAVATGGVGLPALVGMTAIMAPIEGQAVYEDLINAGAPENMAAPMAAVAGGIIGLLESAGRIPLLRQVSPLLFGGFKKRAMSELAKKGLFEVVKKFGRNFTIIQFSEVATEVAQEVVGNVAVSFYDENRSIVENLPDIAVKTAVATIVPSLFGAGVSVRMVKPSETAGLTDLAKKAKGWLQDEKGNWFEAVREIHKGEEGFIRVPEEMPEVTRITEEIDKLTGVEKTYWDSENKKLTIYYNPDTTMERARIDVAKYLTSKQLQASVEKTTFISVEKGEFKPTPPVEAVGEVRPEVPAVETVARNYVIAGDIVDGRVVKLPIPNQESIEASLENFEVLPSIREVPLSAFPEATIEKKRTELANEIEASGEITPLIVVIDDKGAYILEGANRFDALVSLGAKSFPAQVVIDRRLVPEVTTKPPAVKPPVTEPFMPEAGIQPAMIPEVTAREVRPAPKAEIVQISMEDQLKLEEARRQAEEAPIEEKEAYEAQAEIEGLRVSLQLDPVAQHRVQITGKKVGLDFFISLKEKTFPEYFTVEQAKALYPGLTVELYTQPGTPQYNKVSRDVALDDLTKKFNMTPDEIADRVMAIRQEKRKLKQLEASITEHFVEKPLTPRTDLTTSEVTENWQTVGQPKYTLKQAEALTSIMGEYILSENSLTAWEMTLALRSETNVQKLANFWTRAQKLVVEKGFEQGIAEAKAETLAEKMPVIETDYFQDMSVEMREAFFAVIYHRFDRLGPQYRAEMLATITALVNAIGAPGERGRAIPRIRGKGSLLFPEGGSAWDRLNFVFGKQPKALKAIEKIAKEGKTLPDFVEGVFHEIGREPVPVDQAWAEHLRNLSDVAFPKEMLPSTARGFFTYDPTGKLGLEMTAEQMALAQTQLDMLRLKDLRNPAEMEFAKAEIELETQLSKGEITFDEFQMKRMEVASRAFPLPPVTKYEAPIEKAFKELPLWPTPVRDMVVRSLKELGMLPVDIGNFLRANKASFDFSFWRQQAPLIASHPISFAEANVEAWKLIWSQKASDALWTRIIKDPTGLYQIYEICEEQGGDFLRPMVITKGMAQHKGTEEFGYAKGVKRLLPMFTMWLPWIKISARVFEGGTNWHNWLIFKNYYKAMLKLSEQYASGQKKLKPGESFDIMKEMVDFSKMLANFTARGSLGKYQIAAPALSGLFFAPRMSIGRILSVKDLINANPRVRAEAWKNAATFVSTLGGIVLLGAYAGWWDVEKDPRSAEYMSIRIGNVRVDPWGGYRQFLVFFVRAFTGTGVSSVTGAEYKADPLSLMQTLLRGKASPLVSLILDFWRGENFIGEEVDVANKRQWAERVAPFAVWDIYEAYMEDPTAALQIAIPAIVGAGVQTYTGDWVENWPKLGLPKYSDNLAYGLAIPSYDTADFWTDTSSQFAGVDPETLTEAKGYPPYIKAIAEARIIKEHLDTLPNEKLVSLNADPAAGATFADYYQMWRDREKIVATGDEDKLKEFDQDERTRNAQLGNFSQRQFSLLNQYWAITDKKKQAEFLEKHKADIGTKPRQDYLRSHSSENAQLAVWGQAKILSKEAYTEFNRLVKELDIPDDAIPELTLPPETSIDTHFTYEEMVSEGTHSSVEADLLLLKDYLAAEEAEVQSYADWKGLQVSDKPVEYLQLRVDNANLFADLKEAQEIVNKVEKKAAVDAVRATKVGAETFLDIERRVDSMGKGTREVPIPDETVNAYVEHMRIVDETSGNSAEAKLNRYDNPELNDFLMSEDYHGEAAAQVLDEDKNLLDNYYVPTWRIDVLYRTEDAVYDALLTASERQGYLSEHMDYRMDRRRREALKMTNKVTGDRFPLDQIENFVGYYEIPIKGKRQERFLVDNPEFAKSMHNIVGIDIPKPEDVPSVEYDNIYDEWQEQFDRLEGLSDHESEHYIEDAKEREVSRNAMRFSDGKYTAFGLAEIKQDAYAKFVPEEYVNAYVGYYKIIGEGKPENWKLDTGTDLWYEDDWFMMENIEFYRNVYRDLLGNEKWDFTAVPTREVFSQYLTYIALPHLKAKDDFRWNNRDLDAWLVLKFDYTPIAEKKRRKGLTPYERFMEEWEEKGQAIEELLGALRE